MTWRSAFNDLAVFILPGHVGKDEGQTSDGANQDANPHQPGGGEDQVTEVTDASPHCYTCLLYTSDAADE